MTEAQMTMAEVSRALVRIEAKLDRFQADHESRIRAIERWIWASIGAGSLGTLAGVSSFFLGG